MARKINESIVKDFIDLQKRLPSVLDAYGITHAHVYTNAGISRSTYERKLKDQTFSAEEMLRICAVINK